MNERSLNVFAAAPEDDSSIPFAVAKLDVRGRSVRLGAALDRILTRHAYPDPVSELLGQAVTLTALLGASLKFQGRFILQIESNGPVSLLVADFTTPDRLRAYARFDADAVAGKNGEPPESLLGTGSMAMTIDQGSEQTRYQGVVALDGSSLEEMAHAYFRQSEQIPTRVRLAVGRAFRKGEMGLVWRAGGLMIQHLPVGGARVRDLDPGDAPEGVLLPDEEDEEEPWIEALALMETVEDQELIDPDLPAERLLFRLFHENGVRAFERQSLVEKCRCSRERLFGVLRQFSPEERVSMIEDGAITATCEFCNTHYRFDPAEFDPVEG